MGAYTRGMLVYSRRSQSNSNKMKENRQLEEKNLKTELVCTGK